VNGGDLLKLCEEFQVPAFKNEVAKFMTAEQPNFLITMTKNACERQEDTSDVEAELRIHAYHYSDCSR
jgi:hypothetical protein